MKQMRIKKLHRLCSVRGCNNTVTYAISRSREIGASMIICAACLRDALAAVEAMKPKQVVANNSANTSADNTSKTDNSATNTEKSVVAPKTAATAKPKATSKAKTAAKSTAKSK